MESVVPQILRATWVLFLPLAVGVALVAVRQAVLSSRAAVRIVLVALAAGVVVGVMGIVFPFRVDASGLLELMPDGRSPTQFKGTAGKAFVDVAAWFGVSSYRGVIACTRATAVLLPLFAAALVLPAIQGRRETAIACTLLVASPLCLHGSLGVFNFWFFPLVSLGLCVGLTTLETLERSGEGGLGAGGAGASEDDAGGAGASEVDAGVAGASEVDAGAAGAGEGRAKEVRLASVWRTMALLVVGLGVLLIGFSRPETMASAALLALVLFVRAAWQRDLEAAFVFGGVLVLFAAWSSLVAEFLLDRMRHQPLLMGTDVSPGASTAALSLVAVRRVLLHVPRDVLFLGVVLHVVVYFAVRRLLGVVRETVRQRRCSLVELAAAILLVTEFVAVAVHREGFFKITKYGQLVVVPAFVLGVLGEIGRRQAKQRQRLLGMALCATLIVSAVYSAADFSGWGAPCGWRVPGRADRLLWYEAPRLSEELCRQGRSAPATVLVLGLDERKPRGVGIPWLGIEDMEWESDIASLPIVFRRAGCKTATRYPEAGLSVRQVLDKNAEADPLCGLVVLDEGRGPQPADVGATLQGGTASKERGEVTHVLVTYLDPRRRPEVLDLLLHADGCAFKLGKELPHVMLFERVPPARRSAASLPASSSAGSGPEPLPEADRGGKRCFGGEISRGNEVP